MTWIIRENVSLIETEQGIKRHGILISVLPVPRTFPVPNFYRAYQLPRLK
jgi:hypothetical protein